MLATNHPECQKQDATNLKAQGIFLRGGLRLWALYGALVAGCVAVGGPWM
jgi:hypothetical protein